jgi:hypothetical protein
MLKINLVLGPFGNWEVSQAKLVNPSVGAQFIPKPPTHQGAQTQQQIHHGAQPTKKLPVHVEAHKTHGSKIPPKWRARPTPSGQTSRDPSPSPQTDPSLSIESVKDPEDSQRALLSTMLRRLGSDADNEVQIAGDATKWLLRLRDGRSLVLSVACLCRSGVTHGSEDTDQTIVPVYDGDTPEISENWSDEDSVADSVMDSALEALTHAKVEQMTPPTGE